MHRGEDEDAGAVQEKHLVWIANFPLGLVALRCRRPHEALALSTHAHRPLRGRTVVEGRRNVSVASTSGDITTELATACGTEILTFCQDTERAQDTVITMLTRLADGRSIANRAPLWRRSQARPQTRQSTASGQDQNDFEGPSCNGSVQQGNAEQSKPTGCSHEHASELWTSTADTGSGKRETSCARQGVRSGSE